MTYIPLLGIQRDGNSVVIKIDSGLSVETCVFVFPFSTSNEAYAELLREQLNNHIREMIRKARADSYLKGYADGRAKRAKNVQDSPYLGRDKP